MMRRLYQLNRSVPTADEYAEMLEIEEKWLGTRVSELTASAPRFTSRTALFTALSERLRDEEAAGSQAEAYLAEQATLEQFKVVVGEFAVDGLVESLSHLPIVPRLPHRAGMAVFRVLIDELGCGNVEQAHSQLYRELLAELGMSTELESYVDNGNEESYAYVNLFHWLARRAPAPETFLGAYAYFEASVLYAFKCYAAAAKRLGVRNDKYYTEHLYIDDFHSKQMRTALMELDAERGLDLAKVWAGVELTSEIAAAATEAAVAKAREVAP
ncbi:iron-containing redox enzyme family protein [Kutzneria chonburiensis]|uniref:Iron-containing redox enzyme family protein n=1 Tax=Kutzneria chonburiensis TaxID=1483604 RepID=A0ABV6N7K2_9PSEU|nr:iron-containing redox enzyme family protein [Kutzneria chonburiensis]